MACSGDWPRIVRSQTNQRRISMNIMGGGKQYLSLKRQLLMSPVARQRQTAAANGSVAYGEKPWRSAI